MRTCNPDTIKISGSFKATILNLDQSFNVMLVWNGDFSSLEKHIVVQQDHIFCCSLHNVRTISSYWDETNLPFLQHWGEKKKKKTTTQQTSTTTCWPQSRLEEVSNYLSHFRKELFLATDTIPHLGPGIKHFLSNSSLWSRFLHAV